MEFFVKLVDSWRPQTNATKGFILVMQYMFVKQLLQWIRNIKIDLFFLMIWIIVWSQLLAGLTIDNKIPIILINIGLLCTTIVLS